jgi:hypothetical protein
MNGSFFIFQKIFYEHYYYYFFFQREEILASRRKRSQQLEVMLEESKQQLHDHNSGLRLLSDKERLDVEKRIQIYQRKLETLTRELDDREIERILRRERLIHERVHERREERGEL